MKITLLIGSLAGGGAERVVCNLANYLVNKGHEVTILTVSDQQTYMIEKDVRHIILYGESKSKLPHGIINIIRLYRMNRYFRKNEMDIYITFLPKLSSFILAQKKFISCPILLAERADPDTFCSSSKKNNKIFKKYYPRANGYIFQTDNARNYYKMYGIDVENSVVIPNAINPEFVRPRYQGIRRKVIAGAGRLREQKNFSLLIRSFAKISKKYPDYVLEIYGDGPLRDELEKEAENLDIGEKVKFQGYVNNLGDRIQDITLFVLSSEYEGMPNVLMEAMALGLPVISTDCPAGGSAYLIKNRENGLLIAKNNEGELVSAMTYMLNNVDASKKMGEAATKISQTLDADIIYKKWEEFILLNASKNRE